METKYSSSNIINQNFLRAMSLNLECRCNVLQIVLLILENDQFLILKGAINNAGYFESYGLLKLIELAGITNSIIVKHTF